MARFPHSPRPGGHGSRRSSAAARGIALSMLLLGFLVTAPASLAARDTGLEGTVVREDGTPLALATVGVSGTERITLTDAVGTFRFPGLPAGDHHLVISAPGYGTLERTVTIPLAAPLRLVLRVDPVALEAVTVTGTMRRTSVAESPVKVEVVPLRVLQRNATNDLTQAIQFVNGLNSQVDCGVCYTNNIRINGMEGPYTAVLIDGMPVLGSLASVYGLSGLNPALVQQVEIIKGPASTLYGSEAMAGVVNVITKDPRFAPGVAVDLSGTTGREGNVDFALASEPGDFSGFLSGNVAYNQHFVDQNGDGFSDFPLTRRAVVFGKLDATRDGLRRGGLSARYLHEDRFGGVAEWTRQDRGSDQVYGEWIVTNRTEVMGSWLPGWSDAFRFEGAYTWHDQRSYYGSTRYDGTQHLAFGNLIWGRRVGAHDLLVGATTRLQHYDDNTRATPGPERRFVPGVMVQDEIRWGRGSSLLTGLRADHHDEHGLILSPRLAIKWEPGERTALRLNAGTGFRVVNLFTEDHAALSGSRDVVIVSELQPERSRSLTLNVNHVMEFGPNPMMIDLDLFHTRFSNRIVPDYDRDPGQIVYDNLDGHAVSRGIGLSFNQNVDFDRFLYSVGVTLQDVYVERDGVREKEFFAPRVRGVGSATWTLRSLPLAFDWTGSITGPMRLPAYEEPFVRLERSPTWTLHNVQGTWSSGQGAEVYLAVKNLLDYVQPSPLVNPEDPFSESFDTAWVYGPLRGRHLMLGVRWGASR
jgi:outer membrane receptor for ferrienterochelin and colicins